MVTALNAGQLCQTASKDPIRDSPPGYCRRADSLTREIKPNCRRLRIVRGPSIDIPFRHCGGQGVLAAGQKVHLSRFIAKVRPTLERPFASASPRGGATAKVRSQVWPPLIPQVGHTLRELLFCVCMLRLDKRRVLPGIFQKDIDRKDRSPKQPALGHLDLILGHHQPVPAYAKRAGIGRKHDHSAAPPQNPESGATPPNIFDFVTCDTIRRKMYLPCSARPASGLWYATRSHRPRLEPKLGG
jgi:hypothetical protein